MSLPLLTTTYKLGSNRNTPRIFIDSDRLLKSGFTPGSRYQIEQNQKGLTLLLNPQGYRNVSSHGNTPVIDLNSHSILAPLAQYPQIKAILYPDQIHLRPTIHSFFFHRKQTPTFPLRTVELFAGGGTLTSAIHDNPNFKIIAGVEIEPKYANVWSKKHPNAHLIQSDIRTLHPAEIPAMDVLIAGIPCTCFSTVGRTSKKLAQNPESGDSGDLFLHVLFTIQHHRPSVAIFENVISFGTSTAGNLLKRTLETWGYSLTETTIEPHEEWGEPSDRRRWCLVASMQPGFQIQTPKVPFTGTIQQFIDPPHPNDEADAQRIAQTIKTLTLRAEAHKEKGNGFGFTTINHDSSKIPTIIRSYHKINSGPFVQTPWGPRLLRQHEIEAIMGTQAGTSHYATAVEILGQGVQTRIWSQILSQIASFLKHPSQTQALPNPRTQNELFLF